MLFFVRVPYIKRVILEMMKYFGEALSGLHQEFNRLLRKKDCFDEAVQLFLYLHSFLHLSQVSGCDWNEVDSLCF